MTKVAARSRAAIAAALFCMFPFSMRAADVGIPAHTLAQIRMLQQEKAARTPAQRKMDSHLVHAAKRARGIDVAPGVNWLAPAIFDAQNNALVDIRAKVTPRLLDSLRKAGGEIVNSFPEQESIRAKLPITSVEAVAEDADVKSIRVADLGYTNIGSVTSEGDATHRAGITRTNFGVNGSGVKIGLLSDSLRFLGNSVSSGDLGTVFAITGQDGVGTGAPDSGEGTAMLELVHDIAPGAQLYFATAKGGMAQMAANIRALRNQGCNVIIDDFTYAVESPFQDGVIDQAVNEVSSQGVLFFSSAANSGNLDSGTSSTWEGDFNIGPFVNGVGTFHNWGGGNYTNQVLRGTTNTVVLFWAEPIGAATSDYDLYVYDAAGNIVSSGTTTTSDSYEVALARPNDRVAVVLANGTPRFIHVDAIRAGLRSSTSGSTRGHNAPTAANAFGVAASDVRGPFPAAFRSTNVVENFSSDGPRRKFFYADGSPMTPGNFSASGGILYQKPDITAADGSTVSAAFTTNSGLQPFFGTSAAAPHAGAIAALLLSYKPSLTPAQVRAALQNSAIDIHASGWDRDSGWGIIMADAALGYVSDAPNVAITTPTNGSTLRAFPAIHGTATDHSFTGIDRVDVVLQQAGQYWDWNSETWRAAPQSLFADVTGSTWTYPASLLPSGANVRSGGYVVTATAYDNASHTSAVAAVNFTVDGSAPTIAFNPLTNGQVVFNFEQLGGTLSETATVKFKIEWFQASGNLFWNGGNWTSVETEPEVLRPANVSGLNWSPAAGSLPSRYQLAQANYLVYVYATDSAGNTGENTIVLTRSPLDTTPPSVSVNIADSQVFTNNFLPAIQATASDPESGVDLVTLYLMRLAGGGYEYWNGSAWSANVASFTCNYQNGTWAPPFGFNQPSGGNLLNGRYVLQVSARNREAPANTTLISVNFDVDWHPVFTWTAGSWSDGDPNNNNDNWDNPANWTPFGVPPAEANVFINGNPQARHLGSVTVNGLQLDGGTLYSSNLTVKFLTQNAGRLHVENRLQLADNGIFKWSAGEFYGGSARLGSLNNPVSGLCVLSNSASKALYSATFNNSGTVRWYDGHVYADEGTINNGPTGLWESSAPAVLNLFPNFGAGNRYFNNFGTFRKLGSADTAHQGYFTNYGVMEVNGGLVTMYDYFTLLDGSRITGSGTVRLVNGCCGAFATVTGNVTLDSTLDLNQGATYIRGTGILNVTSNGVVRLTSGFLGGNVNVSGAGQIVWDNGGFDGTNTVSTTINAMGSLNKWLNRYNNTGMVVLNTSGTVNWNGGFIFGPGRAAYNERPATWNNYGDIRVLGDGTMFSRDGDYPILRNFATITKIGGTNETAVHSFLIDNYASISAQTGTLAFVDAVVLQTNTVLNGASLIRFAGNIVLSNVVTASGRVRVDGGSFTAATNSTGALSAWTGTNILEWQGGTFYGHHVFRTNVVMNIADPSFGAVTKYLGSGSTLDNYGVITWAGQSTVYAWGRAAYGETPSVVNNLPGATFRLLNDGYPFRREGDYTRFTNYAGAVFVKSGGTNRSTIDSWIFANAGEVRADVGTNEFSDVLLMLPGGRFTGAGGHLVSAGSHGIYGTSVIDGTIFQQDGGTITGDSNTVGTLRTVNNGLVRWAGGTLAGRTAWGAGSDVEVNGGQTKYFASGAVLDNSGSVRFLGTGQFFNYGRAAYGETPATWNNLPGAAFDAQADGIFAYEGIAPTFVNFAGATFRKSAGASTVVYWQFNNAGLVQASAGRIELAGGGLGSTGTFLADGGAQIKFTGGTYTFANATISGAGKLQVDGATVTTIGNVSFNSPASLDVISGRLDGFGTFTGATVLNWLSGWMGGTQHVAPGSVLNIAGDQTKYLANGSVLNNHGIINWSGGGVVYAWARPAYGESPSTINNFADGAVRFLTDGTPFVRDGLYSALNNYGLLAKVSGTNETTIHSFIVNNYGTIASQTGTLAFVDYLNLSTNSQLSGVSPIRFAGFITLSNDVTATGTVQMDGGWFNAQTNADGSVQGVWKGSNVFQWVGGTLNGHHTFASNVVVNITNAQTKYLGSLTRIDNFGQINWGAGNIYAWARGAYGEYSSVLQNRPGGTVRFLADGVPFTRDGDYAYFTNHPGALVVKSGGTASTTIQGFQFANRGELRANIGTLEFTDVLRLENGGLISGLGTNLISAGAHTLDGTTTLNGKFAISGGTITGLSNAILNASTGTLDWSGGTIGGEFTFGAGLRGTISGGATKAFSPAALIHNRGVLRWTAGNIWSPGRAAYGEQPMTFINESGATLVAESDSAFDTWGAPHTFSNMVGATFVKTNSTGTTQCYWIFNNSGVADLQSGILALNVNPTLAPGSSVNVALGGLNVGSEYARLVLAGAVALNGSLTAKLKAGFTPALSNAFDVVTYGSETGQFNPLTTPALPPGLKWNAAYGNSALTLRVGQIHSLVGATSLANGHFQFSLQGPASTRAVVEATDDLNVWTPIRTNAPFTGVLVIDDADGVNHPKRFYRVQIVP